MSWIALGLVSAFFLGIYDILKKRAVADNAVLPTIFLSSCCATLFWLPWMLLSRSGQEALPASWLYVEPFGWRDQLAIFAKSAIVSTSWILSYFALKRLPISIASTVRATSPIWTLAGAFIIFEERLNTQQWLGVLVTLGSFYALSWAGGKEGVVFLRNRWVGCIVLATILGSCSSLYDRHLLANVGYSPVTLQAYFTVYQVVFLAPFAFGWWRGWWARGAFEWRWSIPFIGLGLLAADAAYFNALANPEALVSVISCLRRGSVLIIFAAGYLLFRERNYRRKTPCVLGVFLGVCLLALAG